MKKGCEYSKILRMIQDISPSKLNNHFEDHTPRRGDKLFVFDKEGRIFACREGEGTLTFPVVTSDGAPKAIYLFSIDDSRYFLAADKTEYDQNGYEPYSIRQLRDGFSGKELYAAFTAYHLWKWYSTNKYCGVCASELEPDKSERALRCRNCQNIIYPRINPAVIVGVTDNDKILITRYKTGYAHNALIAGFCEIGETVEETVAREVMEEAGIKVKNIRYYKSQPWGMAQDMLMGFYCDVDGDNKIRMDEGELSTAEWTKRGDIVLQPGNLSLTNEMMMMFKENKL